MTRTEQALICRLLNDQGRHAIRATSETFHLFTQADIDRAREQALRSIERKTK